MRRKILRVYLTLAGVVYLVAATYAATGYDIETAVGLGIVGAAAVIVRIVQ